MAENQELPVISVAQLPRTRRFNLADFSEKCGLIVTWGLVIIIFGILEPDTFLTLSNFQGILGSQAVLVVLTCALIIPLTAGDIDLSVVGTLMLSQMMIGVLNAKLHWPIMEVLPLCIVMGVGVGLFNGLFAVKYGIESLIVTLGTQTLLIGIDLWISHSITIAGIAPGLSKYTIEERFLGVPLAFYYGVGVCMVLWYIQQYTALGRRLLFVGRNRSVSRLSGINVSRMRVGALVAAGVISSLAGILYAGTTGAADPVSGATFLLPAFAAAFLGATSIIPGRFNPWGSFISVYFLVTGITGLTLLGFETFVHNLFYGGALVMAVTLSQLVRIRRGGTQSEITGPEDRLAP